MTAFRAWARPPAGLRHPRVPAGHLMSVQSVCLGWHWQPYAYSPTADDTDGWVCVTTWPGYTRTYAADRVYTYPGDGTKGWPASEIASEVSLSRMLAFAGLFSVMYATPSRFS